jgi:hypothetical protein
MDWMKEHMTFSPSGLLSIVLVAGALGFSPAVNADVGADSASGDDLGYDAIVNQLNKENSHNSSRAKASSAAEADPFDSILMHGGVGFTTMVETINLGGGQEVSLNNRGIQAAFGIDLFSENWMAEGTARSFGESEDSGARASLKEFELKVFYKEKFTSNMGFRVGPGLSGRYLTIQMPDQSERQYTTPSGIFTAGLDFYLNQKFSVGLDMNGRTAMINETIDHNSLDATLRLDAHF